MSGQQSGLRTVTHAAIRFRGITYSLPRPNRHHNVIWDIVEKTGVKTVDSRNDDQGFLDNHGNYLTRRQALRVARAAGQLKPDAQIRCGLLFSEDVW
jgi:hypothetical protein